jgi:hypothetical protein
MIADALQARRHADRAVTEEFDPRREQLARWARYPTKYVVHSAAVTALAGMGVHVVVGYLLFDRHAHLRDAIAAALWFGLGLFVLVSFSLLWTRRQARRGRRAWWLADPGE